MPRITARTTKAEILEAYGALESQLAQAPTWEQIGARLLKACQAVAMESVSLVKDCYNAGAIARQWISTVQAELSRPVLRSEP
jgi:hypothetical protein